MPVSAYGATARGAASGGGRSGAGLGDITRRRSLLGLVRPDRDPPSPSILRAGRSMSCQPRRPRHQSRFDAADGRHSTARCGRSLAGTKEWSFTFPIGRCERRRMVPVFRRLAALVGSGNASMRDAQRLTSRYLCLGAGCRETGLNRDCPYKLAPKSCPTGAGRLKSASVRRPETHAGLTYPTEIRPGSAIGRNGMPARVVDRGSIRRRQRPRNRGTRSSRRLPTPRH